MRKAMFVGAHNSGKTTLIQRLHHQKIQSSETQSIEFCDDMIDTPGEYTENRHFYTPLITTSVNAKMIAVIQSATDNRPIFPPGFVTMFQPQAIGIINKIDIATPAEIDYAVGQLREAGIQQIFKVSALTGEAIPTLNDYFAK